MASQFIIYLAHVGPFALLWLATVLEWIPLLSYGPSCECFQHVVIYAPFYAVIGLGIYAAFSVALGVATFNDCDLAKQELLQEVQEARKDLTKKKVI